MNEKWSISKAYHKLLTLFIILINLPNLIQAHSTHTDTIFIIKHDTVWLKQSQNTILQAQIKHSKYDRRIHRYKKHWKALIPTYTKIQIAGNMGLLSIGPGWDYGKREQWETDLLLGFLPRYSSKRSKMTITVKQNFTPWSLGIKQTALSIEPLSCGLYINTVFGDEFWVKDPDRFPQGYYGFSSKIRFHVFVGQRLSVDINRKYRFMAKKATFFYELSTCDLYLISAAVNRYLKPKDYLCLSFGLKLQML